METASSGANTSHDLPDIASLSVADDVAAEVTGGKPATKSFLSRAFEPVTNLFKSKSQLSHQRSPTPASDDNDDNDATTCNDDTTLASDASSKDAKSLSPDKKSISSSVSVTVSLPGTTTKEIVKFGHQLRHIDSGEATCWWEVNNSTNDTNDDTGGATTADDNDNDDTIADDITMNSYAEPPRQLAPVEQRQATPPKPEQPYPLFYRIKRIESGEKAWWMEDTPSQAEAAAAAAGPAKEATPPKETVSDSGHQTDVRTESKSETPAHKIRYLPARIQHADSGELPWWMQTTNDDDDNDKDASETIASAPAAVAANNDSVASPTKPVDTFDMTGSTVSASHPLGDRASPEGVEDPAIQRSAHQASSSSAAAARQQSSNELFISRHTNIDDLLGGSCHQLSPLLDDRRARASPRQLNGVSGYFALACALQILHAL